MRVLFLQSYTIYYSKNPNIPRKPIKIGIIIKDNELNKVKENIVNKYSKQVSIYPSYKDITEITSIQKLIEEFYGVNIFTMSRKVNQIKARWAFIYFRNLFGMIPYNIHLKYKEHSGFNHENIAYAIRSIKGLKQLDLKLSWSLQYKDYRNDLCMLLKTIRLLKIRN